MDFDTIYCTLDVKYDLKNLLSSLGISVWKSMEHCNRKCVGTLSCISNGFN